ncbi:hypothetical protein D3C71_749160 [compost metagenome]
MIKGLQLVEPGMHPLSVLIFVLLLGVLGVIGIVLIYSGIKWLRHKKNVFFSIVFLLIGIPAVCYLVLNWMGYNQIYNDNAKEIIGVFYSQSSDAVIEVKSDNTWICTGKSIPCKHGTWEYIMSEDWCYWNIDSDKSGSCFVQTGDPNIIQFRGNPLVFKKHK